MPEPHNVEHFHSLQAEETAVWLGLYVERCALNEKMELYPAVHNVDVNDFDQQTDVFVQLALKNYWLS